MLGTIVNCIAIIVGCFIGMIFKHYISEKINNTVFIGLALCTLYIGINGAIQSQNTIVIIISMVIGGGLGELIDLDNLINKLGQNLERKFIKGEKKGTIAQGFISASLLFCVGAMTILGSLQSGMIGDNNILYAKSALDFVASIIYSSTLGIGVGMAAMFVFVYQGFLTITAQYISPLLTSNAAIIIDMNAVGSIIIVGLAFNMLKMTKIKVANFIPAIFIPIIIYLFI